MAKTVYSALMQITSVWLNKVFNHRHDGLDQDGSAPIDYAADNGAANAYAIALTPPITAHIPGLPIYFKAANANTGASTLSVNGLAAVAIKKTGFDLSGGEIQAGEIVGAVYNDAATPYYQLINRTWDPRIYSVTGGYAATVNDSTVLADATSGAFTVNLPVASGAVRKVLTIKKADTSMNTVTVTPNGAEKIDGASNFRLYMYGDYVTIQSDGANWFIIAEKIRKPMASAHRNAVIQSVNGGVLTRINLTAEEYDTHGYFDSTANYRFQPLIPGKYRISAGAYIILIGVNKAFYAYIYKNGAGAIKQDYQWNVGSFGVDICLNVTCEVEMNGTTDYIELYVYHSDTGAKDIHGSAPVTYLQAALVERQ